MSNPTFLQCHRFTPRWPGLAYYWPVLLDKQPMLWLPVQVVKVQKPPQRRKSSFWTKDLSCWTWIFWCGTWHHVQKFYVTLCKSFGESPNKKSLVYNYQTPTSKVKKSPPPPPRIGGRGSHRKIVGQRHQPPWRQVSCGALGPAPPAGPFGSHNSTYGGEIIHVSTQFRRSFFSGFFDIHLKT